jgi:hypothetical protein
MNMNVTRLIGVVACGLAVASCTSWMPSFDLFTPKPTTANLAIESDPPGAEARASLGGTCRTPCTLPVPVGSEFTVSYALNGYVPQSVPVRPVAADSGFLRDASSSPTALLDPNPVFAELHPAAPPPKPPPPKKRRRPVAAAAPPPAPSLPPPPGGFAPPPGAFTPSPR